MKAIRFLMDYYHVSGHLKFKRGEAYRLSTHQHGCSFIWVQTTSGKSSIRVEDINTRYIEYLNEPEYRLHEVLFQ